MDVAHFSNMKTCSHRRLIDKGNRLATPTLHFPRHDLLLHTVHFHTLSTDPSVFESPGDLHGSPSSSLGLRPINPLTYSHIGCLVLLWLRILMGYTKEAQSLDQMWAKKASR